MATQNFRARSEGRLTQFGTAPSGAIPQFGAAPQTGIGLPAVPRTQAARPVDFSGIQQVLQGWQQQAVATRQEQQAEEAAEQAAEAQTEMGAAGLAQPPDDLNRVQRQAWEKQTIALYDQQIRTTAIRKAAELQLENQNNPQGFDRAWAAYTDETLSTIAETDARLAANARAYFDGVGMKGSVSLLEQQHANIANATKAEAQGAVFEMVAASANIVRNNATEQVLAEQQAEVALNLQQLSEANLFSGAEIAQMERDADINLTRNFVEGQVLQAFEDQDFDRVQFIEDELRTGKYFADNRLGDQIANDIARRAGALRNEINGTVLAHERELVESAEAIMQQMVAGVPITPEQQVELNATFSELTHAIDPDSRANGASLQAGIAAFQYINENINEMSFEELQAARAGALTQEAFLTLPPRAQQAIVARVDSEIDRITEAMSGANPDVTQAGLANVANASFFQLMGNEELLNQNRELAAERTGMPLETIPYWNNNQVAEVAEALEQAAETANTRQFNEVAEAYLQPYTESEAAGLNFLGEINPEMGGIALVAHQLQTHGIQSAAEFSHTAVQGRALGTGHTVSIGDLSVGSRQKLQAMAETHGLKMNMVMSAVTQYGRGLAVTTEDPPRDVRRTAKVIDDVLANIPTVTLGNGMEILSTELGTTERLRELRLDAINEIYDDRELRRVYDMDSFRPVPMPDGTYQFRNKETGVYMYHPDDSEGVDPITARVSNALFVEARRANLEEQAAQAQAASEAATNALMLTERPKMQFAAAAEQLNIPQEDAMGLFRAIGLSPGRNMHRMPGGIAPEVLPQAEGPLGELSVRTVEAAGFPAQPTPEMEVARDIVDSIMSLPDDRQDEEASLRQAAFGNVSPQDEGRLATLVLFGGYLQRFGDRRMALAAIHAGEEEVTAAMEIGGESWLDAMAQETRAFVAKGMRM